MSNSSSSDDDDLNVQEVRRSSPELERPDLPGPSRPSEQMKRAREQMKRARVPGPSRPSEQMQKAKVPRLSKPSDDDDLNVQEVRRSSPELERPDLPGPSRPSDDDYLNVQEVRRSSPELERPDLPGPSRPSEQMKRARVRRPVRPFVRRPVRPCDDDDSHGQEVRRSSPELERPDLQRLSRPSEQMKKALEQVKKALGPRGRSFIEQMEKAKEQMKKAKDVPQHLRNSSKLLPPNMSEQRVVLLGNSWSERSSVGNFILGKTEFNTEEELDCCLRVRGQIEEKEIVLINTPDLLHPDISQHKLSEYVENCVSLSDPGPHVFLLVLQPEDFTEEHKLRLCTVLQLFSDQSFDHSLILISTPREESPGFMEEYRQHPPLKDLIRTSQYRFLWRKNLELAELLTRLGQIVRENNGEHLNL